MASKAKKLEKKVLKALEKENRKTLEELNRLNPPKDDPQVQTLPQQDDLLGIFPGMKKKVLAKKSTFTVKLRRSFADTKKPSIEEDKPEPITIVERKSKKVEQNASVPTMDDAGPELEQGGSKPDSRPSLDTKPSSVRSRSKSGRGRSRSRSESRDTKPRSVRSPSKSGRRRSRSRSRSPGWSGRGWKRSKSPGKIKAAASKRRGETLCRFFAQGRCSRGDRCAYLHSYAAVHAALAAQADDVEDAAGKRESSKRRTMEKSSRSNSHGNRNKSGDGKDVLAAYSKLQSQYDSMVSQSVNKDRPKSKEEKHQKEQPSILPGESTQTDSQDQHKSRTTATSNISDGQQDDSKRSDPRESELGALFQAERRQPTRTIDLRAGARAELRPQRMGIEPGDDSGVGAFLATQRAHHSSSGGEKGRQETRSADKVGRIQKKRSRSTESTEDARRGQREKATNEKDSSRGSERKDRQAERAKKPERGSLSAKTGGAKEAIKWKGTATNKKKLNQGSSAADRWDPEPEDTNDILLPTKKQKKKKKEKEKKKKRHSGDKDEGSPVGPSISVQEEGPALPPQNSSDDDSSDDEGLGLAGGVYATALYVGDGVPMHEQGPKGKKRRKRKGEDSENGAFYAPPATLYQPEGEEQSSEQHVGEEHRETSELHPEDEGKKQEDDPRGELFRQYLAYGQKFLRPRRPAASSAHATSPRLAGSQAPSNQAGQGPMPVSSQSWPPATLAATPSGVSTAPSTLHPPVGPGMSWQTSASVQDRSTEVPAAPETMADAVTHHQASPALYLKHSVSPIVKEVSAMEGLNVEPPQDGMSWSTQSAQRALEPTPAVPVQPEHQQPSLAWSSYMPPEVANILMGIPAAPKPEPAPEQPQPAKAQNEKVVESAPEQNQVTLGSNEEEEEEYDPYPDAQSPPPSPPESNNDAPGNLAQSSTALPAPTNPTRPEPSTLAQPVAPTGPPIVVGTMLVGTKVEKPKALEARPPSAPPPKKQATGAGWGGLSKKEDSQSATSQPQIVWVNQATAAAAAGAGAWGGLTKAPDHTSWGAPRPAGHGGYFLPGPAPTGAKSTAAGAAAGAAKKGAGAAATVAGAVRPAAAVLPSRLPRARAAAPKAKPKAPPTSSGAGLGGLGKAQKIAVEEEKKAAGWGGLGKAVVKEGAGGADAKKVGAPKVPKPVKPQPAPAEAERSVTRFAAMLESFIDEEDEVPARPQVALPSASAPEIALPPGALIDRSGAPPPTAVQQTATTAEHTEKKGPPPSMTARAVLGAADTKALDNLPLSDPSRPPVLGPLYYAAPQASAGLGGTFYFAAPHQAAAGIGSLATPSWAFLDPTLAAAAGPPVGTGPVPSLAFTDPAMVAASMAAANSSGPLMTREQFEELQRQEKLALERRAKLKELKRQEKLALERRAKLKELINKK